MASCFDGRIIVQCTKKDVSDAPRHWWLLLGDGRGSFEMLARVIAKNCLYDKHQRLTSRMAASVVFHEHSWNDPPPPAPCKCTNTRVRRERWIQRKRRIKCRMEAARGRHEPWGCSLFFRQYSSKSKEDFRRDDIVERTQSTHQFRNTSDSTTRRFVEKWRTGGR